MNAAVLLAGAALIIWIYLLVGRGAFWRARAGDGGVSLPADAAWPRVTAIVPARNEAEHIGETVSSLLAQDYPGEFSVIVVDDQSDDGTAEIALNAARAAGSLERVAVLPGSPLPDGWTGKLWAVRQGVAFADVSPMRSEFLLLTDADIAWSPHVLRDLVSRAMTEKLALFSLMVKLRCASLAERTLIPAFVFFFQKIYPFTWVNDPSNSTAAGAGGCMLVRRTALAAAGGIDAIRTALIDDCAMAKVLKSQGPIRLALTERLTSMRPYPDVAEIRRMVVRSAFAQLDYSVAKLAFCIVGLVLTYLCAPAIAVFGTGTARLLALAACLLMTISFVPMLRFYRLTPAWALALPAIAAMYMVFTVDSAVQYALGRGGLWKGRAQALAEGRQA